MNKQDLPEVFKQRIERFNKFFKEGTEDHHDFEHDELFDYEMTCIELALTLAKYIPNEEEFNKVCSETEKYIRENAEKYEWESQSDFEKRIEEGPTTINFYSYLESKYPEIKKIMEDHSGNSVMMSFQLFRYYISKPLLVPYLHGCLAPLVGDAGYYDDRKDIPPREDE